MKFLIDRCVGRKLAEHLRAAGHDVLAASELGQDPGDEALLAMAHTQGRILITIDKDFGTLLFTKQITHSGLVRLPDSPARRRIELIEIVLSKYPAVLQAGAIVTVRGGRIRVSRQNPKPR